MLLMMLLAHSIGCLTVVNPGQTGTSFLRRIRPRPRQAVYTLDACVSFDARWGFSIWLPTWLLMQNWNPRFDPQDRAKSKHSPGVGVPAKGDSSGSDLPPDLDATLVDFPQASSDPDATLVDGDAPFAVPTPPPRFLLAPRPHVLGSLRPLCSPAMCWAAATKSCSCWARAEWGLYTKPETGNSTVLSP